MPKKRLLTAAVALALSAAALDSRAQSISATALPSGGRVVGGQATISQVVGAREQRLRLVD